MKDYLVSRAKLLEEVAELYAQRFGEAGRSLSAEEWRFSQAREQELLMEYAENLPYSEVSRCPICKEALQLPIDVEGLDGPWWWRLCSVDLPPPQGCVHFQVYLGALNWGGRIPNEITRTVMPGPEKPFVIDRLLKMDGVVAVLSSVTIQPGYTGFITSYFSEEPLDQKDLHQEWRKETYLLRNPDGEPVASGQKLDPWNFDLQSWVGQGKLFFIRPGDSSLTLLNELPDEYRQVEGVAMHQYITNGEVQYMEAPQGGETGIYDPVD